MKLNHNNMAGQNGTKSTSTSGIGCQTNYLTWQEAMADGMLPPDWTPGYSTGPADFT